MNLILPAYPTNKQLTIFLVPGTRKLIMYIETAGNIDLGRATGPGSIYRRNPRCKYWEELMDADFHGGWTKCEEIHSSDKEWNDVRALLPPGLICVHILSMSNASHLTNLQMYTQCISSPHRCKS